MNLNFKLKNNYNIKKTTSDENSPQTSEPPKKKQFKMLSAFTILFILITIIILISWILKWSDVTTSVTDENGFTTDEKIKALGIFDIFLAPMQGFLARSAIIIFILSLGAFINILISSRALEGFSQSITSKLKGKEIWAIIPLMVFFSICGTTEGMAEESLGFYMICIPLMIAAGFDKLTGLFIVLIGAGTGVLASTVNPFAITIAVDSIDKSIINTSAGDGLVWRIISWFVMTSASITFVVAYAWKIKKNPQKSVVFDTYEEDKKFFLSETTEKIEMNWKRKTTLIVFALTFILMIFYLIGWDTILGYSDSSDAGPFGPFYHLQNWVWNHFPYLTGAAEGFGIGYLDTVAAIFLVSSLVLAIINGFGEKEFINKFITGASDLLGVCLVIAVAAGIGWILQETLIQNLVVNGLASSIGGISSPIAIIIIMFILFLPLSFIIPSSSGFATAVFPLLSGVMLKDTNVLPSGLVTAFSFANGILNLITPTSGVVMGAIAITRIDYAKFLKAMMPIVGILIVLSIIMLAIGGAIGSPIA